MLKAIVREARPSDKEQLMSFIKDIWGGHDYIPHVWDQWLGDTSGRMFVVELGGVPIGMNRVRFLEDGSAWFEGVRVHPEFRGRGYASLLGENSVEIAKARGVKTFRLTSGSHNRAAHRQIARIRFDEKARFSVYRPKERAKFRSRKDVHRAEPADAAEVRRIMTRSREFKLGKGMFWDNFTAISLAPRVIENLVREGAVWTTGDAVAVVRIGKEGNETWNQVCFLGGGKKAAVTLARHIMSIPTKGSNLRRFVFVPHRSPLIGALRKAGFEREFSMVLFERSANG